MPVSTVPIKPVSLTTAERDALVSPVVRSLIWNSTTTQYEYWDSSAWIPIVDTSNISSNLGPLTGHSDVIITTPSNGDSIVYNGTDFINFQQPFQIGVARNNRNATNEWLRVQNGTPTNNSPIRFPFNVKLISLSASGRDNDTWSGEVHSGTIARNGGNPNSALSLATININNTNGATINNLNVSINANSEIGVFMRGNNEAYPQVIMWFVRTI